MIPVIPTFDEYVDSLSRLTAHVDPTALTAEGASVKEAASSLTAIPNVTVEALTAWARAHPEWVPALGLAVGLGQEKLKNTLKHRFNTSGWVTLARTHAKALVEMLDREFELVRLISEQRNKVYDFGDLLVARAGGRATATRAGKSGRGVEDEIERIAIDLRLPYQVRTRFAGRGNRTAPCDLVIPSGDAAAIVVAAKGFDSTGSKLTDAVREVEEMAEVRLPTQFVIAVIDGIGWKNRSADLRKIYRLWEEQRIDGMYTLATLDEFRAQLSTAARLRGLLPIEGEHG